MTNTELQEKIARLETELAEVKEMAVAMKKRADGGGAFKPENGQKYWSFTRDGCASSDWWTNHPFDKNRYALGNCFPTKQAAEDAVRALKLIHKARESRDGFVPDWGNREQYKYALYSDMGGIYIMPYTFQILAPIFGFWEDESVCEQFIDENRDELRWFFTEYGR